LLFSEKRIQVSAAAEENAEEDEGFDEAEPEIPAREFTSIDAPFRRERDDDLALRKNLGDKPLCFTSTI
jgi:hypothetical protein